MANWTKLMKDQSTDYRHNLKYLKRYQEEKDPQDLEWLVLNNANLVHKIVGSYRVFYSHKLDYDDLFSVGLEGLLRAIEKFDFSFETSFATYATYWIKQSVARLISDEGFTIKIPTHIFESLQQMIRQERIHNEQIPKEKMCQLLNINGDKYDLVQQVRNHMLNWTSLNRPLSHVDETEIGDLIDYQKGAVNLSTEAYVDSEAVVEGQELQRTISKGLSYLDPREKMIIINRFGLFGLPPLTLAEIGRIEGVSRERIRQLEGRAIRKLKNIMRGYEEYM